MRRLGPHDLLGGAFGLRPLRSTDGPAWLAIVTDPLVFGPTSWDVSTLEALQPALERHVASGLRWAVIRTVDGALVGTCGAKAWDASAGEAEVAYELSPSVWGRGVATAAVRCFLAEASAAGLRRVIAHTWVGNAASGQVLTRCGFTREASLPAFRESRGEWRDFWRWGVTLPSG